MGSNYPLEGKVEANSTWHKPDRLETRGKAVPGSQIGVELDYLEKSICAVNDEIGGLELRLGQVLQPSECDSGRCDVPESGYKVKPVSPLAARIGNNAVALQGVASRVRGILDLLEL